MTLESRVKGRGGGGGSDFGTAELWLHQTQPNYMIRRRPEVWKALISITGTLLWRRGCKSGSRKNGDGAVLEATGVWSYIPSDKSQMVAGICDTRQEVALQLSQRQELSVLGISLPHTALLSKHTQTRERFVPIHPTQNVSSVIDGLGSIK